MKLPGAIKPTHQAVRAYYAALANYAAHGAAHEGATETAFSHLLADTAGSVGRTLIPKKALRVGGKTIFPDGTLFDTFHMRRGYWEAKDTGDDLDDEIQKKIDKQYPLGNIIFEDTRRAVLFQNRREVCRFDLTKAQQLADLLNQFYAFAEPEHERFEEAVAEFQERVPELAEGLTAKIKEAHDRNKTFQDAFADFFTLCQTALNPNIRREAVDEMLVQHLLTEHYPGTESSKENRSLIVGGYGRKDFALLMTYSISDLNFYADPAQCLPFYVYDEDGSNRRENITDWALAQFQARYPALIISKWDIFHYVYGLLHHPGYRSRFADNLKRDLPRLPFAPDFAAFAAAGRRLADWHLNYETLDPYPLQYVETPDVPLSYVVGDKMKLSADKTSLRVNDSLTLAGIPPEVFGYRLGNRSALEWVIDQYRVTEDARSGIRSDPNRADDAEYIVRLIGQVVRVSVETVKLVAGLPPVFTT